MDRIPKITVGMPVRNGERYIRGAIESILAQTLGDFELIISDNGSTDRTEEICRDLARLDDRVVYERNPRNLGAAWNYNRVVAKARSTYFRWANADDISGKNLHQRCHAALEANPEAVLAYGGTVLIDGEGRRISSYHDDLELTDPRAHVRFQGLLNRVGLSNVIYGLMRIDAMRRGPLMGDGGVLAADVVFMAGMSLEGFFIEVPGELFFRRMHGDASSDHREDLAYLEEFWSAGTHSLRRPQLGIHQALLRAALGANLPWREKVPAVVHVIRRVYWRRREILEEVLGRNAWRQTRSEGSPRKESV